MSDQGHKELVQLSRWLEVWPLEKYTIYMFYVGIGHKTVFEPRVLRLTEGSRINHSLTEKSQKSPLRRSVLRTCQIPLPMIMSGRGG